MYALDMRNFFFFFQITETIAYVKKVVCCEKSANFTENNLRVLQIENAKFSVYLFLHKHEHIGRFSILL